MRKLFPNIEGATMNPAKEAPKPYTKPQLTRHGSIRDITFECPQWQCSVTVPPAP